MEKDIIILISESYSVNDLAKKLFNYTNGRTTLKVLEILKELNIDVSVFDGKNKNIKNKRLNKMCPVCNLEFETIESKKEKTTCSVSCSNAYFKHGINNPNFDELKSKEMYEKTSKTIKKKYANGVLIGVRKDIGDGKSIRYIKKECPNCKCEYNTINKNQKYCSKNCSTTSDDVRKKLSEAVKKRIDNGTHKGWQSRNIESYPERFFKEVLKNNDIEFEFNKPINKRDLGIDCDCNYFLDFYIKEANIDLEIDGSQHKYRKEHDLERDSHLSKVFNIYRIEWKCINSKNGKEYIEEEIKKFIEYYNKMKTTQQYQQQKLISD